MTALFYCLVRQPSDCIEHDWVVKRWHQIIHEVDGMPRSHRLASHTRPQFYADGFVIPYPNVSVADYHHEVGHRLMSDIVGSRTESTGLVMSVIQHWQRMAEQIRPLKGGQYGLRLAQIAKKAINFAFIDADTNRSASEELRSGEQAVIKAGELPEDRESLRNDMLAAVDALLKDGQLKDYAAWRRDVVRRESVPVMMECLMSDVTSLESSFSHGMVEVMDVEWRPDDLCESGAFHEVASMLHNLIRLEVRNRGDGLEVWIGEPAHFSAWSGESLELEHNELTDVALLDDLGVNRDTLVQTRLASGALAAIFKSSFEAAGLKVTHQRKSWNEDSRGLSVLMHDTTYVVPEWARGATSEDRVSIDTFQGAMLDIVGNIWQEIGPEVDEDRVMEKKAEVLHEVALYPMYAYVGDHVMDMTTGSRIAELSEEADDKELSAIATELKESGRIPVKGFLVEIDDAREYLRGMSELYGGGRSLEEVMDGLRAWDLMGGRPVSQLGESIREEDDDALLSAAHYLDESDRLKPLP